MSEFWWNLHFPGLLLSLLCFHTDMADSLRSWRELCRKLGEYNIELPSRKTKKNNNYFKMSLGMQHCIAKGGKGFWYVFDTIVEWGKILLIRRTGHRTGNTAVDWSQFNFLDAVISAGQSFNLQMHAMLM